MKKISIIGAGAWGTALAIVLKRSRAQHRIALWVRENDVLTCLENEGKNPVFLPGFAIPPETEVSGDFGQTLAEADLVVLAVPSTHMRGVCAAMLPFVTPTMAFASAAKGLETESLLRMTEVIEQALGPKLRPRVAAISGPSFAKEVARGDPTAIVTASADRQLASELQLEFSGPTLRLYTNDDVIGVEMGGATKNVIAIAAGVAEGLGLGHNTIAALITRGLTEMTRLGTAMGARRETLAGLSGMGDLVLTCTGDLSRNRTVGAELGRGKKLADILKPMRTVAEGIPTTAAARTLGRRVGVEMPITEQMYAVLYEGSSPRDAIRELMERRLKPE